MKIETPGSLGKGDLDQEAEQGSEPGRGWNWTLVIEIGRHGDLDKDEEEPALQC